MPTTTPTLWGTQTIVSSNSGAYGPSVAALSQGGFAVVYQIPAGTGETDLVGQVYNPLGDATGGNFMAAISGSVKGINSAEAVQLNNGSLAISYVYDYSTTDHDIGSSILSGPNFNGGFTSYYIDSSLSDDYFIYETEKTNDGNYVTLWDRYDVNTGNHSLIMKTQNSAGNSVTSGVLIDNTSTESQSDGDLTILNNGNTAVTWKSYNFNTGAATLLMRIFDPAGNALTGEIAFAPTPNAGFPSVEALSNGNFVVAWQDVTDGGIYNQIYNSFGSVVSGRQFLPSTFAILPKITALQDGGYVLGWSSYGGAEADGSPDGSIVVQRFSASGALVGGYLTVNNPGDQSLEDLQTLSDGRIVLTFTSETGDSTNINELRLQIIDPRDTIINGTSGIDNIVGRIDASEINGLDGNDTLSGMNGNDILRGGAGNDVLNGGDGSDRLEGGIGDDSLEGQFGNDLLIGGDGNDFLSGREGQDTLQGGAGNDQLYSFVGQGPDVLDGGEGSDLLFLSRTDLSLNLTLDLGITGTQNLGDGTLISGIERLTYRGTSGVDRITGGALNDELTGNSGNDSLSGGAGNDTLDGGAGTDTLLGGAGDDTIVVRGGDTLSDLIDAGAGTADTLKVDSASTASVTLAGFNTLVNGIEVWAGNGRAVLGTGAADRFDLSSLTSITGLPSLDAGSGNDTVIGSGFADSLLGGAGTDALSGGAGNDTLTGGASNDTLDGGAGSDTIVFSGLLSNYSVASRTGGGYLVQDLRTGSPDGTDTVLNAEVLRFSDTSVTLAPNRAPGAVSDSNAAANQVAENASTGTLVGVTARASDPDAGDSLSYTLVNNAGGRFAINATTGVVTVANGTLLDYETATGHLIRVRATDTGGLFSEADFTVNLTNVAESGASYTGTAGADVFTATSAANWRLSGLDGNDSLTGAAGNDTVDGGLGADTLAGGAGADQLIGGAGTDTADYSRATAGIGLDMAAAAWTGAYGEARGDVLTGIERVNGSAYADVIRGTSVADALSGNAGNDLLLGQDGADTLTGGDGNDTIEGGAGADNLNGQAGTDLISYASATGGITLDLATLTGRTGEAALDTIQVGFEGIIGTAFADTLSGTTGANVLEGGAGNDLLSGRAGVDTFVFRPGSGIDRITDFTAGAGVADVIEWHGQFTSFAGVQAAASDFTGTVQGSAFTGVKIVSGADTLYLQDVTKAALVADDFTYL